MSPRGFVREVMASVWSQKVFTAVMAVLIAAAATTILTTSGRAAATEEAVLRTVDQQGTRTLVIQTRGDTPLLTTQTVDDIQAIPLVQAAIGFGPVRDVTAAAIPDGPRVGSRVAYGSIPDRPAAPTDGANSPSLVWTSRQASRSLGLPPGAGSVRLIDGAEYQVAGQIGVPDYLQSFEPLTLIPATSTQPDAAQLSTIVVLARQPEEVALLGRLITPLLGDLPRENVSLSTSENMAALRGAISGELTRQARIIVLGVLTVATGITLVIVWGFVLTRRKDLGRRRALGASRSVIVALVVGQVFVTAAAGALAGALLGLSLLAGTHSPPPEPLYVLAVAIGLTSTASLASALPAAMAANRDPLRELRVP